VSGPVRRFLAAVLLCSAAFCGAALAVQPDEILADPKLEAEARKISAELRCLVCQNQSIDDSDAPLARDLRLLVRERLTAGDNREGVIDFVVARYGEFVLLRPRLTVQTLLLWIAPLLLVAGGLFLAWQLFNRGRAEVAASPPPLSEEERARLKRILEEQSIPPLT
jgi:cytochrome c-type biogenesis protein CcmH